MLSKHKLSIHLEKYTSLVLFEKPKLKRKKKLFEKSELKFKNLFGNNLIVENEH